MPPFAHATPAALILALSTASLPANAGTFTVLHAFTGGSDGANPLVDVVQDNAGNTYGTAIQGANNCSSSQVNPGSGCGTLWKIDTNGNFSVLVTFTGTANGAAPVYLAFHDGKLYGAAAGGGANDQGLLYRVDTNGRNFTILHDFNGTDGCIPGPPVWDQAGDLIDPARCGANNNGEVFKITPGGAFSVLYTAAAGGGSPGNVIAQGLDTAYTVLNDPSCPSGASACGSIVSINPTTRAVTQLRDLASRKAGVGDQLFGRIDGTLFGVSFLADGSDGGKYGYGTFFAYKPAHNRLTILHQINAQTDGWVMSLPVSGGGGIFYGTSFYGGSVSGSGGDIYSITSDGTFTVLFNFTNPMYGGYPESTPVWNAATSTLYGAAYLYGPSSDGAGNCIYPGGQSSGYGCGTVFSFKP
jgi:uncharacterized repeat protein (TIGR03803 family)